MKKIFALCLAALMVFSVFGSFAIDEQGEIKAAMKAIQKGQDSMSLNNEMTMDGFLKEAEKLLPEGSSVKLSFSKESDFRVYKASSEKDGSIFANILFTCGPYTQHEMYYIKMKALTGAAAEANKDNELLDEDKKAVKAAFSNTSLKTDITKEDILKMAESAVKNGSKVSWGGVFNKVDSTTKKKGSVKCTVKLTLNQVSDTVTINNTLKLLTEAPAEENKTQPQGFTDVPDGAYFKTAVTWAVSKNITSGTSATTFSPNDNCTKAQILTFLWRAMGSPEAGGANPFSDVTESDYYYKAALWAAKKGMTDGSEFAGNTPCTRAMTVTYLWINAGAPDSEYAGNFTDVSEDDDIAVPVSWAVDLEITSGTSDTTFSPDAVCSRGQIVTFLERTLN